MSSLPRWVWIVLLIAAIYLIWRMKPGQNFGPVKITYDKIGQALDRAGDPLQLIWRESGPVS